jgi:hypothetical protein
MIGYVEAEHRGRLARQKRAKSRETGPDSCDRDFQKTPDNGERNNPWLVSILSYSADMSFGDEER